MTGPIIILSILSIVIGYNFEDLFVGPGSMMWGAKAIYVDQNITSIENVPITILLLPTFCSLLGGFVSELIFKSTIR